MGESPGDRPVGTCTGGRSGKDRGGGVQVEPGNGFSVTDPELWEEQSVGEDATAATRSGAKHSYGAYMYGMLCKGSGNDGDHHQK